MRFRIALIIFLLCFGVPHFKATTHWAEDHPGFSKFDFYKVAAFPSDWITYHSHYLLYLLIGLTGIILTFALGRKK